MGLKLDHLYGPATGGLPGGRGEEGRGEEREDGRDTERGGKRGLIRPYRKRHDVGEFKEDVNFKGNWEKQECK